MRKPDGRDALGSRTSCFPAIRRRPAMPGKRVRSPGVQQRSGLETPRTRFATEYVFATLSSALRAGISEREQRAAQGRFTAPGRDESFATETRVWSRSRFRRAFQPLPRCLTCETSMGLKHAGCSPFQNSQARCRMRRHVALE